MKDIEITLLSEEDITGTTMLNLLKQCGLDTEPTDLSQLFSSPLEKIEVEAHGRKTALYFTKTIHSVQSLNSYNGVDGVIYNRVEEKSVPTTLKINARVGIRPVLKLSSEKFDEIINSKAYNEDGLLKVHFGEYPQWVPSKSKQELLAHELASGYLTETGRVYTFDNNNHNIDIDYDHYPLMPIRYKEFCNNEGKKFIRVKANFKKQELHYNEVSPYFRNETTCFNKEYVWVEVTPITWLVDKKTKSLVSENVLVSGIIFSDNDYIKSFEESEIYKFLNKYMLKEILDKTNLEHEKQVEISLENIDEYEEKLLSDKSLTEEEIAILKDAINKTKEETNPIRR